MNSRERILKMHSTAFVERTGKGLDPEKQQALHDAIAKGIIPIGPKPEQSPNLHVDLRPKYDGEEAWLIHKALRNGGHIDARDLPKLRQLLDEAS